MRTLASFWRDIAIAIVALAVLVYVGIAAETPWTRDFLTSLFAYGLLAMSLNLLIGTTGLVSFGHAAFFALGGYAFGLLLQSSGFLATFGPGAVPVAFVLAVAITAVWALVVGLICARLSEIYFAFLTLAFQMFLYSVVLSWVGLTGGDQGLMGGIPRPVFLGIDLSDPIHRFVFCAAVFVVSILVLRVVTASPFGYTLRLIRDNPRRAAFLGINVLRAKVISFVLAGSVASVGGIILALFTSGAYPEWMYWSQSGQAIFMIMLGGINQFFGPLLGAVLLRFLNDMVLAYTEYTELATGVAILLVVLGLRRGILDFVVDLVRNRRERTQQSEASASLKRGPDVSPDNKAATLETVTPRA
ncbi:branched-chain amino acid ABC transporter permease [Acuticoccus sediminis]|uniref:Branched-chain amino acid ABC transporter permease n=1 Tax=Acuticoccus sediminis TaxID=2184697 RepID=A0A8B2NGV6_9HYPH|nr:branched-chain amino acid ABC transporter permease [Acuticoccus sediminis]RAH98361.1 branched-chain amino acid ABC transporter permease [Acuticoccus sediminis]